MIMNSRNCFYAASMCNKVDVGIMSHLSSTINFSGENCLKKVKFLPLHRMVGYGNSENLVFF